MKLERYRELNVGDKIVFEWNTGNQIGIIAEKEKTYATVKNDDMYYSSKIYLVTPRQIICKLGKSEG